MYPRIFFSRIFEISNSFSIYAAMQMPVRENIRLALDSIKGQKLRTVLTMLIIMLGIISLVGTLTAVDVLKATLTNSFTSMGANTFTIRNRETTVRIGRSGKQPRRYRAITYYEALEFSERFTYPATVSVSTLASMGATLKFGSEKTNPNIRVFGSDENYIFTGGYEIAKGRNFSPQEVRQGDHVVILGSEVATTLFTKKEDPVGQVITVGSNKYRVIGVLKSKGNSAGMGGDKMALLPVENVRQYFSWPNMSYTISVLAKSALQLEPTIGEATGVFRIVRKVPVTEEDNFEITKSDSVAATLIDNLSYVTLGATLIGIITLFGAAIGLMNIMLVSVTERTREIGVRKSLGATKSTIRNQFLVEAIVICQLGGLLGIILSLVVGLIMSLSLDGTFSMPWVWILAGIVICFVVGVVAGLYPAQKAARLDPIEALRYE